MNSLLKITTFQTDGGLTAAGRTDDGAARRGIACTKGDDMFSLSTWAVLAQIL